MELILMRSSIERSGPRDSFSGLEKQIMNQKMSFLQMFGFRSFKRRAYNLKRAPHLLPQELWSLKLIYPIAKGKNQNGSHVEILIEEIVSVPSRRIGFTSFLRSTGAWLPL